jgi:hypothetical protein
MRIDIVGSAAALEPEAFDALEPDGGAVTCFDRVRQIEYDRRWRTRYLRVRDGGSLLGAVPFYTPAARQWPDSAYDPGRWGIECVEPGRPEAHLIVGGVSGVRGGLHLHASLLAGSRLLGLVRMLAREAAEEDRGICFPYVYEQTRRELAVALGGRLRWAELGREASFSHHLDASAADDLGSRVRGVLNRDERLISQAGVVAGVRPWLEVADAAAEIIAAHNVRKDKPDHAEFVRMRYADWAECASVRLLVFTAATTAATGYLTALRWRDQLDLREIGLTGQDGPDRIATYVSLLYHQPVRYARQAGLRVLRAGIAAHTPKSSRGARFSALYGAVADAHAVRALAAEA